MFRLQAARSPRTRLAELERFLEFWYGPRRPEYGEPESRLDKIALPSPLWRFYAFAGRWPSPEPLYRGDTFFEGHGAHHLRPLDGLKVLPRRRLNFFMEYQGDFDGLTPSTGDDPPVWIQGVWGESGRGTARVSASLSRFLVTHCLMATVYEHNNSRLGGWADPLSGSRRLAAWLRRSLTRAERLWAVNHRPLPHYAGTFYLLHGSILVLEIARGAYRYTAIHPAGVARLSKEVDRG
jgi:hypothetical protein